MTLVRATVEYLDYSDITCEITSYYHLIWSCAPYGVENEADVAATSVVFTPHQP